MSTQATVKTASPVPPPTTNVLPQVHVVPPAGNVSLALVHTPSPVPFLQNPANLLPIVAFIGVILTIIFGWKKMKVELAASANQAQRERDQSREQANLDRQHHADQAHQERITKARREVYLELISEMTKSQTAISLLPAQDAAKLDVHSGFAGLITVVAKISVLGEMETVIKSRELLTLINETMFRVIVLLIPIDEHKNSRREHESKRDRHQSEFDRLVPIVDAFARKRVSSLDSMEAISQQEFHRSKVNEHSKGVIEAINAFSVAHRSFMETVMEENRAINLKIDQVIYSIRNELALSTSLEELERSSEARHAAVQASTAKLYATIDKS